MPRSDYRYEELFRDVYERIDSTTSDAPAWAVIPKSGIGGARPRWNVPSIALATATAAILLIGIVAIGAPRLGQETAPMSTPTEGPIVAIYLADDISNDQIQQLIGMLSSQPGVISRRYVDKAQAYEEALDSIAGFEPLLRTLEENPDLIPASIRLLTESQAHARAIETLSLADAPTNGVRGGSRYHGTLWSASPAFAVPGPNRQYINEEHGFEITYPEDWYRADEILAPALSSPPQLIEEVLSLGTYPLRPGGPRCPNVPENALMDLTSRDVLISIMLGGVSGVDRWPEAFGAASFPPRDVPVDAQTCIGQPNLDVRTGSFTLDGRDVRVMVAFGADVTLNRQYHTWQILDSFKWTDTTGFDCPVTIPPKPGFIPPDGYPSTPVFGVWYGTEGLWTVLETDGSYRPRKTVLWSANFPGGAEEERPAVDVTWTRLDAGDVSISNDGLATNAYTPEDGDFMIAGLDPREQGCWEVTARYKGAMLSYVYFVPGVYPTTTTSSVATTTTTTKSTAAIPPTGPLFGEEVPWILLFDDGLDGVLAIDPNERIGSRSAVAGHRAGDQPYRLTLVDDHLVVGWGAVYASHIRTGQSTFLGGATIYVPAAEPGLVWLIKWAGGPIGQGDATVWQVNMSGETVTAPEPLDADGYPAIGVPGGLALQTEDGLRMWYPGIGADDPGFGGESAIAVDVSGDQIAYCPTSACLDLHITDLASGRTTKVSRTKGFNSLNFGGRAARFSPDGTLLALTTSGSVILVRTDTSGTFAVAGKLTTGNQPLYVSWSPDGTQLFAATNSYGANQLTIMAYDLEMGDLATALLPFGGTIDFVVLDRSDGEAYFAGEDLEF